VKHLLSLCCLVGLNFSLIAQDHTSYQTKKYSIQQKTTVHPKQVSPTFDAAVYNLEAPTPGGNSMKAYITHKKELARKRFPIKTNAPAAMKKAQASNPSLGKEFGLTKRSAVSGDLIQLYGGRPNDNTLAVSNEGIVLTAMNSFVYAYNLNTDTTALEQERISLKSMAGWTELTSPNYFDPKLIYDEEYDRFILVFLKDNAPSNNQIIVCFSTTNDPDDPWNVYELPGNPLDNNRWTDFPALAISGEDLFLSGNLIVPGEPWQIGFDGSIVWQIERSTGYSTTDDLNTKLYSDIKYDDEYIRNLHIVRGADGVADKQYMLSNRNFDITNDTIFVMDITGNLSEGDPTLNINLGISDLKYGVPPNGRQEDTDTTDASSGLQTNDARVLAAIKINDQIQFVSNSMNPATGLSSIYHGTIENLDAPEITANFIASNIRDFGYPNIAWTGKEDCDIETIIAFNHTSPTDYPGISCVYYGNDKTYSEIITMKEGDGYVDRFANSSSGTYGNGYERWGDYFGLQRKYNEGNKVYSFGYYGTENNKNTGWCNEIISPDNDIAISGVRSNSSGLCQQTITIAVSGGIAPYSYSWKEDPTNTTVLSPSMCAGDSVTLEFSDATGCILTRIYHAEIIASTAASKPYPNPFTDQVAIQFQMTEKKDITVSIFNVQGKLVHVIYDKEVKAGQNELVFSMAPLTTGEYFLKIHSGSKEILTERIVKL